ncbi:hypothetical protein niasHT_009878 [Heterodera trifolii]|uniref:Uncharacterized protein n=1 Tax=Heterodera trifolii TaxID=157864 RepID=A0ABD2MD37_9BILA
MVSSPFRAAHRNPNGEYEGYTDTETRPVSTRKQIMAEIACMFGGRIAERMFCKRSVGHGHDMSEARKLARKLVGSGPLTRSKKARIERILARARRMAEAVLWPNRKLIKKLAIKLHSMGTMEYNEVRRYEVRPCGNWPKDKPTPPLVVFGKLMLLFDCLFVDINILRSGSVPSGQFCLASSVWGRFRLGPVPSGRFRLASSVSPVPS